MSSVSLQYLTFGRKNIVCKHRLHAHAGQKVAIFTVLPRQKVSEKGVKFFAELLARGCGQRPQDSRGAESNKLCNYAAAEIQCKKGVKFFTQAFFQKSLAPSADGEIL
ncbi:MAG: hypothetical protein ACI4W6_09475, partial [Acutalibacteraceae bacterium]